MNKATLIACTISEIVVFVLGWSLGNTERTIKEVTITKVRTVSQEKQDCDTLGGHLKVYQTIEGLSQDRILHGESNPVIVCIQDETELFRKVI